MKTKSILFLLLLFSAAVFAQDVKRVAILETVDKENNISYANKLILRASLSKAITNTAGYEAYDRTDVDAIMSEQDFQRTGMVSNDQIKRLGEMTGANYILVAEAVKVDYQNMFITAKLLDVETARTIMTDNVMMGTTADEIQEGCRTLSEKLFGNAPTSKSKKSNESANANITPQMPASVVATEMLVINSKSDQRILRVKKYSYGNLQMDERAFREFLYKNHSRAYADYMKGRRLIGAGWGTFSAGFLLAIPIGCGLLGLLWPEELAAFWGIGGAALVSSIPILGVGYAKRNRAYDLRNYSYTANYSMTNQPTVSLSLQSSQNGIGLALNF
jgi:hypothetical protein